MEAALTVGITHIEKRTYFQDPESRIKKKVTLFFPGHQNNITLVKYQERVKENSV